MSKQTRWKSSFGPQASDSLIMWIMGALAVCAIHADVAIPAEPNALSRPELVARLIDGNVHWMERTDYFSQIIMLPASERDLALREVFGSGDPSYAAEAAAYSILCRDEVAVPAIVRAIVGLTETEKLKILQVPGPSQFDGPFRDIPRQVVRDVVSKNRPPTASETRTVHIAITILAASTDQRDLDLIKQVVEVAPRLDAAWIALAGHGQLDDQRKALALSVYRDEAAGRARIAAAVALAPTESDAANFAVAQIRAILDKFCARDMDREFLQIGVDGGLRAGSQPSEDWLAHREGLPTVAMLRVLHDSIAQPLLFERLTTCKDRGLQRVMSLIAVLRWPDRFLQLDRSRLQGLEATDYEALIAALVYWHPQIKAAAEGKLPASRIDEIIAKHRPYNPAFVIPDFPIAIFGW